MALQPFEPWRFFIFLILYTVGRTPWTGDQPVSCTQNNTKNKRTQTSTPLVGFEPTNLVFERANTVRALDRPATVIGPFWISERFIRSNSYLEDLSRHTLNNYVGSEVLIAVVMKSFIFWDITLCSVLKINHRFGGICRLYLQGRRVNPATNQRETGSMLPWLILRPWRWKQHFSPKRRLNSKRLHGVISQTIECLRTLLRHN
jgi:hypothetical protein